MNVRRLVTDVFSLDAIQLEDEQAVKITDLASENTVTFTVAEFTELVEAGKVMAYLLGRTAGDGYGASGTVRPHEG